MLDSVLMDRRSLRAAIAAGAAAALLALGACGGDDDGDGGDRPKVGDCTNQPADQTAGLQGDYKVVECSGSEAKSKITKDATGQGVTACPKGFFDVEQGEYCLGPK